jgi:Ca2+-binding EF-hand superfamily protein
MENAIEDLKGKLTAESPDFNTIDAFRLIDKQGRGKVSLSELIEFID